MIRAISSFMFIWMLLYFGLVGLKNIAKNTSPLQKLSLLKELLIVSVLAILAFIVLFVIVQLF